MGVVMSFPPIVHKNFLLNHSRSPHIKLHVELNVQNFQLTVSYSWMDLIRLFDYFRS